MKLKTLLLIVSLFIGHNRSLWAVNLDSLEQKITTITNKTERLNTTLELAKGHRNRDNLKSRKFAKQAFLLSKELKDVNSQLVSYMVLAYACMNDGAMDSAEHYLSVAEKMVIDENIKIEILINKGNLYDIKGELTKSLEYYILGEKTALKSKNKKLEASAQLGIGNIYHQLKDNKKALEYFLKSSRAFREINNTVYLSYAINNAAAAYENLDSLDKAIEFYGISLKIKLDQNDDYGASYTYNNLSGVYFKQANYAKASEYILLSIKHKRKVDGISDESLSNSYQTLASTLLKMGKVKEARHFADTALALARNSNGLSVSVNATQLKATILAEEGSYNEAYKVLFDYTVLADSFHTQTSSENMAEMQTKYETEKKDKEITLLNKDKELDRLEMKKQRQIIWISSLAGLLLLIFGTFSYSRYKISQRQKRIISEQKKVVEEQKNIVEHQKEIVEEKNREILDSIEYAKRLQDAILPPLKLVKESLSNSFILYKPKDIVAGDFYWMETVGEVNKPSSKLANKRSSEIVNEKLVTSSEVEKSSPNQLIDSSSNQLILFAAADCTGHGVPGAMVSVVCSNALNRVVKEFHIYEPGKILDKVTDLVIETFEKSEAEVKDGMDISLCSIKYLVSGIKTKENAEGENRKSEIENSKCKAILQWAGANNPLWIVRSNRTPSGAEVRGLMAADLEPSGISTPLEDRSEQPQFLLEEIKADKQPIGKYAERNLFTTHTIELNEGDSIYIFSDGYADQFGGEKGKKFKSSKMKELILSIQHESMDR